MRLTALAVFLALALNSSRGALGYLLRGSLDAESLVLIWRWGVMPLALASALAAAAAGVGLRLLAGLELERGLRRGLAFALGLGLLGEACFLAGLTGRYNAPTLLALAAVFAAVGWPAFLQELPQGRSRAGVPPAWTGVIVGALAFAACTALALSLAPATEWDVVAYHLVIPKLHLAAGRVGEIPWLLHSHWPHLMEALYGIPLAAGLDGAAALLHAAACAAWLALAYLASRRELGTRAAWIALALLAAQPGLLRLAGTAHADGAFALFHLAACVALLLWTELPHPRLLALAGLLSGFAASSKLLGVIPLGALAAWLWLRPVAEKEKPDARAALTFLAPALLAVAPWYLKALIQAGDPVWPFFSRLFHARFGAREIEAAYRAANDWPSVSISWKAPAALVAPALLGAAFAWRGGARRPRLLEILWLPVPLYLLLLARHSELWRFLWPFWPALAATAGWGLSKAPRALAASATLLGMAGFLAVSPNNQLFGALGLRPSSGGGDRRAHYLETAVPETAFCARVSSLLAGKPVRVLLFREVRGYYLDVPFLWGDPVNQGLILYASLEGPAALSARLDELGVTHVLVNEKLYIGGYYVRAQALMDGVLAKRGKEVLRDGQLVLYELRP